MRENLTELVMILDRSGSMSRREETIDEDYKNRGKKKGGET